MMQFQPSDILKPYVKGYSIITIDSDWANEVFYPTGYIEFDIISQVAMSLQQ